jgi:hypothetical protein
MKNFSPEVEAVGAFDWEGLTSQPIAYAQLAVRQALDALEGSEENIFHSRMRVLRVARQLELWKLDLDPEFGVPFTDEKRWIHALWPKSYRYCSDAAEMEEELKEVPMDDLAEITGANLKVLKETSGNVRNKKSVLDAAKGMTQENLKAHLTSNYDQHFEPIRLMPKVGAVKFEEAVGMVEAVEECDRAAALEKIADFIIAEYAVQFEHRRTA